MQDDKKPQWIEGEGWRYPKEGSMKRRSHSHDYKGRAIYMITLCTEGRRPLLGTLSTTPQPHIILTPLGQAVEACWNDIPRHYPGVELLAYQLMPDHLHGILYVHDRGPHIGQMILGFKTGCNQAYRQLQSSAAATQPAAASQPATPASQPASMCAEAVPQHTHTTAQPTTAQPTTAQPTTAQPTAQPTAAPDPRPKHPEHGLLWEEGFHDRLLSGRGQLQQMIDYIHDNPRRLAEKRAHRAFYTQHTLDVEGMHFVAIGNDGLLSAPRRIQVMVHRGTNADIAREVERFLAMAREGAVVISPCISPGEKQVATTALDEGLPLVVLLENGFSEYFKPQGHYFDACAAGRLLMLAPWPHHTDRRPITRQQCLQLNDMARRLCL